MTNGAHSAPSPAPAPSPAQGGSSSTPNGPPPSSRPKKKKRRRRGGPAQPQRIPQASHVWGFLLAIGGGLAAILATVAIGWGARLLWEERASAGELAQLGAKVDAIRIEVAEMRASQGELRDLVKGLYPR